jgi:acetylornithine aminotransferase
MTSSIMPTYARQPVTFVRGQGAWLFDSQGRRYLDAVSGIAVCNLGHAHPAVQRALCEQAGRLIHTSNLYCIAEQETLASQLCHLSRMDNVFFCNSGAEANEAAIKIARRYGHHRCIREPKILVMDGSFHGRTLATLSATGNTKVQDGFAPLVTGFIRVPYDDIAALTAIRDPAVVAVLVEPVQGEGGVRIPAPTYLRELRILCEERGWLLMLDEVQTGIGRTGKMFAHQYAGITPDVMSLAKALGNGVPIGACLARGVAAEMLTPGKHGSTFGGNPLACSAALAVLETLKREHLAVRAAYLGELLLQGFREKLTGHPAVREVRGLGLMIGIELERPCGDLVARALARGLLINVTAERTVRLLPPLILSDEEADTLVDHLSAILLAESDSNS